MITKNDLEELEPPAFTIRTTTVSGFSAESWEDEVNFLLRRVEELWEHCWFAGVAAVVIEIPEFVKGEAVKLAYVVGRLYEFFSQKQLPVMLVGVNEWKGQLSKERFAARFKKRFPKFMEGKPVATEAKMFIPRSSHELDAAGIGLWALGVNWHGKQ